MVANPPDIAHPADLSIVRSLQRNARQTNRALALDAGLAPSSTLARVKELEARGVVTGYHAAVELAALGRHVQALVFVRLQPKTDVIVEAFLDHVWALDEVIGLQIITGVEDVVIHLAVADTDELRRVILEEISSFDAVYDERTSLVFEDRRRRVIAPVKRAT